MNKLFFLLMVCSNLIFANENADNYLNKNFSDDKELFQFFENTKDWKKDHIIFVPAKIGKSDASFAIHRETCGFGLCETFLIEKKQNGHEIIGHFPAPPSISSEKENDRFNLISVQKHGNSRDTASIKTEYHFNGKNYSIKQGN